MTKRLEKIYSMITSSDIEMFNLGASLIETQSEVDELSHKYVYDRDLYVNGMNNRFYNILKLINERL